MWERALKNGFPQRLKPERRIGLYGAAEAALFQTIQTEPLLKRLKLS
jgi:hypothetical protein